MAEGASIAEASVQLSLDESTLAAEVINLQGKLGPALSQATSGMTSVSTAAQQTSGNVLALARGFGQVGNMVASGNASSLQLLSLVRNVAAGIGGAVASAVAGIGAIVAAGYGAFKLGSFLGTKYSGAAEAQAWSDQTGKDMADQTAKAYSRRLSSALSNITLESATITGLDRQISVSGQSSAMRLQEINLSSQIEIARAKLTGEDVAAVRVAQAEKTARETAKVALQEKETQETAIALLDEQYNANKVKRAQEAAALTAREQAKGDTSGTAAISLSLAQADEDKRYQAERTSREMAINTIYMRNAEARADLEKAKIEEVVAAREDQKQKALSALREEQDAIETEKSLIREDVQARSDVARKSAEGMQTRISQGAASIWENMITAQPKDESVEIQKQGNALLKGLDDRLVEIREEIKTTDSIFGPST